MCIYDSNVYLGVNCLFTVAVELASRKRGRVDGTGIRRPELALVIHAKATPSTPPIHPLSSVHPSISTLQWLYVDYPLATCSRRKLNRQSFLTHKNILKDIIAYVWRGKSAVNAEKQRCYVECKAWCKEFNIHFKGLYHVVEPGNLCLCS